MPTLTSLIIEYASKGIEQSKKDLKALQDAAKAAQKTIKDLQSQSLESRFPKFSGGGRNRISSGTLSLAVSTINIANATLNIATAPRTGGTGGGAGAAAIGGAAFSGELLAAGLVAPRGGIPLLPTGRRSRGSRAFTLPPATSNIQELPNGDVGHRYPTAQIGRQIVAQDQLNKKKAQQKAFDLQIESLLAVVPKDYEKIGDKAGKIVVTTKDWRESLMTVTKAWSEIAKTGATTFGVLTGSVTALVRSADPVGFGLFSAKIEILGLYVGRIFIPLMKQAGHVIDSMTSYFKSLTPSQRDSIREWTMLAAKVLGAITVLWLLGKPISLIITLFSGLKAITSGLNIVSPFLSATFAAAGLVTVLTALGEVIHELIRSKWGVPSSGVISAIDRRRQIEARGGGAFSEDDIEQIFGKHRTRELINAPKEEQLKILEQAKKDAEAVLAPLGKDEDRINKITSALKQGAEVPLPFFLAFQSNLGARSERVKSAMEGAAKRAGTTFEGVGGMGEPSIGLINRFENMVGTLNSLVEGMDIETANKVVADALMKTGIKIDKNFTITDEQIQAIRDSMKVTKDDAKSRIELANKMIAAGKFSLGVAKDVPTLLLKPVEILGISEAMKRVQTAATGLTDPRLVAENERNALALRGVDAEEASLKQLELIEKNTKKPGARP